MTKANLRPVQTDGFNSKRYAWYVLFILTLIQFVNYVDRQVIAPLLPLIQADLHLSDTQGGLLGTGFMVVHSIMAIPLGVLADRYQRRKIIAFGVGFWSLATVFSGLATSFNHLLGARAAVGIGEAAYAPAATSLLNDLFPKEQWARVIGIFNSGLFAGGAVGLILGGILGKYLGWQKCFFLVGFPGLILTLVIWMIREPVHQEVDHSHYEFTKVFCISQLWLVITAAACVTFSAGALVFWLPKFVVKYHHFDAANGAATLGIIGIVAGILGVLSGSMIADLLYKKNVGGRALTLAFAFLATIPFMCWGIFTESRAQFLVAVVFISYLMGWYQGPVVAIVSEIVPAKLRGTAIALYMFGIHILGDTPAPTVIGYLSDKLSGGLRSAFVLAILANGIAGILFVLLSISTQRKFLNETKA